MIVALVLLLVAHCASEVPVVGVYPSDRTDGNLQAYMKWLEESGARTQVLTKEEVSASQVEKIFQSINALLLPGMMLTKPNNTVVQNQRPDGPPKLVLDLVERAIKANEQEGDYFPIWGTCKGFEWLLTAIGGDKVLQHGFDSVDFPQHLDFTRKSPGRMFGEANSSLIDWLSQEAITYNDHTLGISLNKERLTPKLDAVFDIIASSKDRKNNTFVAAIEGRKLPFYGTQFHPEHIQFIAGGHIPKTPEAVASAVMLSKFYISEAKKNKHDTAH